jgi:hypothetical protein
MRMRGGSEIYGSAAKGELSQMAELSEGWSRRSDLNR